MKQMQFICGTDTEAAKYGPSKENTPPNNEISSKLEDNANKHHRFMHLVTLIAQQLNVSEQKDCIFCKTMLNYIE